MPSLLSHPFASLCFAIFAPPLFFFNFLPPPAAGGGVQQQYVHVNTTTGQIRGLRVKLEGDGVGMDSDVFFGIPYATPPVGSLRFEKTVPLAENGSREVNATEMPKMCVPHHRLDNWTNDWADYSEDCLFINIFTSRQNRDVQLKPLLVLIYVGGFEVGTRRYKNYEEIGHKFLARGIVVATIQFRIGFLGFASSGSAEMPGNFGYWDLTEALRWLRNNAHAFGADPGRVTCLGYSASGTTVASLALSPHSRELFHQSIQMSGPIFSSRAASDRTVDTTRRMAAQIGCPNSAQPLKNCLKTKSVDQLFDAMDAIGSTLADVNYDLFGPTFDGDFLPTNFRQLVRESRPKATIVGVTELEALAYTLFAGNNSLRHLAIPRDQFTTFGPQQMRMYMRQKAFKDEYFGQKDAALLVEEVAKFYENLEENGGRTRQRSKNSRSKDNSWFHLERTVRFLADVQFLVPFLWEVREKVANEWPLFVYMNKYINAREIPGEFPPELHKSFHDSDHKYVVRHPYSNYTFDDNDKTMERVMVQMFANFVLNGDPSLSDSVRWDAATRDFPLRHLTIGLPLPQMVTEEFDLRRVRFWEQIEAKYPQYNLILGTSTGERNFGTRPSFGIFGWPQMALAVLTMMTTNIRTNVVPLWIIL